MQRICIYCTASNKYPEYLGKEAIKLATWLGKNKKTLINGGSTQGLMNIFSKYTSENGGNCIGVLPTELKERGWQSPYNSETIFVSGLGKRKNKMKELADILIAFPGGVGTMDEMFDAWASFCLGYHNKKIILLNIDGFYSDLIKFLKGLQEKEFIHKFLPQPLIIANSTEECIKILEKYNPETILSIKNQKPAAKSLET